MGRDVRSLAKKNLLLSVLLLGCLCGCAGISNEKIDSVQTDLPASWLHEQSNGAVTFSGSFGQSYQDPVLIALVTRVIEENNDIRVATLNIKSARIAAGLAFTDRLPTPSVSASGSRSYDLESGSHGDSYGISGAVSYEIDLWRKFTAAEDVAQLEVLATIEDWNSARLSLIGTTAELYWQISYLNDLSALQLLSCAAAEKTLSITQTRWQAGDVAKADVLSARQNLLSSREELQQTRRQLATNWHALALLLNVPPQEGFLDISSFKDLAVPNVTPGLPAELLRHRPDLRAAEIRLRKLDKQVAVTRAGYYPTFSLTGSLGSSSAQLREVLQNPVATIGASLAFPFLQWKQMKLDIDQAGTDYQSALISFRDSLLSALGEVEDALSERAHYIALETSQEENLALAREAEQIARAGYRAGEINLTEWLTKQESLRTAIKNLNNNKLNQLNNSMTLCLALGGGDLTGADDVDRYAQK